MMHHYFQPEASADVQAAAVDDWIELLAPHPREEINRACMGYLRDNPTKRPTPGAILDMMKSARRKPSSNIDWMEVVR